MIRIIIPAYNEAANLVKLIPTLPAEVEGQPVEVLVVLDGGTDNARQVLEEHHIAYRVHPQNRGQGAALRTGFATAMQDDVAIAVAMDADGQHNPADLGVLVRPILQDQADFVMGTRFSGYYEEKGSARSYGITFFSLLLSCLTGYKISDCSNGFRALRVSSLRKLTLEEDRFSSPEIILQAAHHHLRFREVPVSIARRASGSSKKPRGLLYPLKFGRVILRIWLRIVFKAK